MPDYGLSKAIGRAVRAGAKGARVVRPGELDQAAKPVAEAVPPVAPELTAPVVEQPIAPAAAAADPAPVSTPVPEMAAQVIPGTAAAPVADALPTPAEKGIVTRRIIERVTTPTKQVSAEDIVAAKVGDFDQNASEHLNFEKQTSAAEVAATIARMAEANKGRIDEARRGIITDVEMDGLADKLGASPIYLKKILSRETGTVPPPEVLKATSQWLDNSARYTFELADKVNKGMATDFDHVALLRQQQLNAAVYDQFMGSRAEWGRSGRVLNTPPKYNPAGLKLLRETMDTVHGKKSVEELAKMITEAGDTAKIMKISRMYNQSKFWGVLNEMRVSASLLTNPLSHIKNTVGNLIPMIAQVPETALAARIGKFRSGEDHILVGEAEALAHANINGVKDALRLAYKTLKTGGNVGSTARYDTGRFKQITAENLLPPKWQGTPAGQFLNVLGEVVRAPVARGLGSMDEFFKTLAYRSEMERQAYLRAYTKIQGLDETAAKAAMGDIEQETRAFLEDPPQKIQELADEYAKYQTYQNDLGDLGKSITRVARMSGPLSFLAPFIRTPINIFKYTVGERTPLALFSAKFRADLTGKNGGRAADMAAARLSMGTATSALIATAVMNGKMTGPGPSNPAARKVLEFTGWQPMSVVYEDDNGDTRYKSIRGMEPFDSIIGPIATAVELQYAILNAPETLQDEQQQVNTLAANIVAGIVDNTVNKSYVKGMADVAEMLSEPKRYFADWVQQQAVSTVPLAGFRSWLTKVEDPYMREAWTLSEKLRQQSGIPGYSQDAPPARDLFGEPREWPTGSFLGAISPMPERVGSYDSVALEINKVMKQSRLVPIMMPAQHVDGMQLNSREYDDFTRLARKEPMKIIVNGMTTDGPTFKEALQETMDSPAYQAQTPDMKAELLRNVQNSYDKNVTQQGGSLEEANLDYAARISAYRQKKDRLKFGQ